MSEQTLFIPVGELRLRDSSLAPGAIALYFSLQSSFPALHWRSIHDCLADLNRLAKDAAKKAGVEYDFTTEGL